MEFLNWKNTLLEWANRLEFLGRPYYSLNLVDIETFYNEFKAKVESVNITSINFAAFIKDSYPDFHAKYNEDGKVNPEDYVFGFSLLMHFSCVRFPDSQFQNICKEMQDETQLTIRTFLQNLIDRKSFSRETIKSVIETSAPAKLSDYVLVLSPVKTTEMTDLCPPTPRTKMLNEWNCENRQLKAQVETERFEKGFLELQVKKQEDQINSLTQERRKFEVEIKDLKSKLSEKDMENIPPNKNVESDGLKRRLRKEISEKDATITELKQKIDDLTDTKQHLLEKFAYVESQYKLSIESTNCLTARLEELTEDNVKKLQHIEGLEITIKDYQKYINSTSKTPSLDTSCDNLDDSYAMAIKDLPQSSMSSCSPENLGKVVDIKLREQIVLYEDLLNKYNHLQDENGELSQQIVDLVDEHSRKTNALELKCRQVENDNSLNRKKYDEKLQEIADLSKESESNLKDLQSLRVELDSLSNKSLSLENQLKQCEQDNVELKDKNKNIVAESTDYIHQIKCLTSNRNDITTELDNCKATINELESTIQQLQEQMKQTNENKLMLQSDVDRLAKLLDGQRSQINLLEQQKQTLMEDYKVSLKNKTVQMQHLEQEKNNLNAELKEHSTSVRALTARIGTLEADLLAAETLKTDLLARYDELQSKSDVTLGELENKRDSLISDVKNLTASLHDEEALKFKLLAQNKELILEKETALLRVEEEKNELSAKVSAVSEELVAAKASLSEAESLQKNTSSVNDDLNQELVTVKASLSEAESLQKNLSSVNDELNQELITVKGSLSEAEIRHKELSTVNDDLNQELVTVKASLSEAEIIQTKLSAVNEKLNQELVTAKASLSEAESLQKNLSTVNDELNQEVTSKASQIETLINENNENKIERETLNTKIVDLTNQIEILQEERKAIESKLTDLSSASQLTNSESQQIQQQLDSMKVMCLDLETQLNQSEEEKEKLFLALQEKTDEAEAIELSFNEVRQKNKDIEAMKCLLLTEKIDLVNEVSQLKSNHTICETKINELQKSVGDLTACNQNLVDTNNMLSKEIDGQRENLTKLRLEKEVLSKSAEQDKLQFLGTIEELKTGKNFIEVELNEYRSKLNQLGDKSILLEQSLKDSQNDHKQLEIKLNDLEIEKDNLKKLADNLKVERDELTIRIDCAEKELISSQKAVQLKNDEGDDLSAQIQKLKTYSEAILIEKSTLQSDLSENRERVEKLTEELERNKTDLLERETSINLLNDQIEDLKKAERAIVESSKLTNEMELEKMKQQMCEQTEIFNRQLSELKLELEMSKEQITAATTRTEQIEVQNSAEIKNLKQTIETLDTEKKSLSHVNEELTQQVQQLKISKESYQKSANAVNFKTEIERLSEDKTALSLRVDDLLSELEKVRVDLEKAKSENMCLTDDNVDLATEIEQVRSEYLASQESKSEEIDSLKSEIKELQSTISVNLSRYEELQRIYDAVPKDTSINDKYVKLETDLKIALSDIEAKMMECKQIEERESRWINDNQILSAKLTKHREITARKEEEWAKEKASLLELAENKIKETRLELEGKLEKMKAKMKHLYTEETSKVKEKHERELSQVKNENRVQLDKYDSHNRKMSNQMYKLNDQHLQLQKENEILKNKLRLAENTPRESRQFPGNFGRVLKMEDEEGEIFNNTYLTDLKTGVCRTSPQGRESIRFSELQLRNSLAPPHLRSTYAAQYGDQNLKEEDISMPYFNDSMFSNQLDVRRGTLYQRPGPPTPSKNGGRLSFGSNITASDLFPKEVLREQNNNTKTKTTPGKLMSLFSSSKPKVENATPKKRLSIFKKKTNL